MQYIPGGNYIRPLAEGSESMEVEVEGFLLDKQPVTVAAFRDFVEATGYLTDAEKFGDAGVFKLEKKEWELVKGAYWEYPSGKEGVKAPDNHPVTQVSWNDAVAYCNWAGKRLPTEKEWEYAAGNNGKTNTRYSWGNDLAEGGELKANVWQGKFPEKNTAADGYLYTAPVGKFGKTATGLSDMGGNVWQWTADSYKEKGMPENEVNKVLKSGSFMCDSSFCHNYKISGRTFSSRETALFHTGFRCAMDIQN